MSAVVKLTAPKLTALYLEFSCEIKKKNWSINGSGIIQFFFFLTKGIIQLDINNHLISITLINNIFFYKLINNILLIKSDLSFLKKTHSE